MSTLYQQDWEAYSPGTDLVPNVPDWTTNGGDSYKIQNYFTSKVLEIIASIDYGWAWLTESFTYTDFSMRMSQGAFCSIGVRVQVPPAGGGAAGYWSHLFGSGGAWILVRVRLDGGGDVVASGTLPAYTDTDFLFRVVIDSADQATYYIDNVQFATFDWSTWGFPAGGIGYIDGPGDTLRTDDLLVTDPSAGGGGAALTDVRRRR